MNVEELVNGYVGDSSERRDELARVLRVSPQTVMRWMVGGSQPHQATFRALMDYIGGRREDETAPEPQFALTSDFTLRARMKAALDEIREALHSFGSYSSRHDALDDLNKLIFAHFSSPDLGRGGIDHFFGQDGLVQKLRAYVELAFAKLLPPHISGELDQRDLKLALRDSDEAFVSALVRAFRYLNLQEIGPQSGLNAHDYANELFGQFMGDSFSDEKNMGQYMTPIEVVRFMANMAADDVVCRGGIDDLAQGRKFLLDPSCGTSSFLTEFLRAIDPSLAKCVCEQGIIGIDKSPRMTMFSLTNFALRGMHPRGLHRLNSVTDTSPFMKNLDGSCRIIITNPPFGAEFPRSDVAPHYQIAGTWCQGNPKSLNSELLLMERYVRWLSDGGSAYVVIPDSILYNKGLYEALRKGISKDVALQHVISLPPVTFAATGTSTKTSIIHFQKKKTSSFSCFFAVCSDVGYDVNTRGTNRQIVRKGENLLTKIEREALGKSLPEIGKFVELPSVPSRWDASYHVCQIANEDVGEHTVRVRDVAQLVTARQDPRRFAQSVFEYIEIGDVDQYNLSVSSKRIPCKEAPSRARKAVSPGQLLVSTVRPERRSMGVVPLHLKTAIASTGFAALECKGIDPYFLGKLLQTDFCNAQVARNNAGIAYPVIEEAVLLDVILPIAKEDLERLSSEASLVRQAYEHYKATADEFADKLAVALKS